MILIQPPAIAAPIDINGVAALDIRLHAGNTWRRRIALQTDPGTGPIAVPLTGTSWALTVRDVRTGGIVVSGGTLTDWSASGVLVDSAAGGLFSGNLHAADTGTIAPFGEYRWALTATFGAGATNMESMTRTLLAGRLAIDYTPWRRINIEIPAGNTWRKRFTLLADPGSGATAVPLGDTTWVLGIYDRPGGTAMLSKTTTGSWAASGVRIDDADDAEFSVNLIGTDLGTTVPPGWYWWECTATTGAAATNMASTVATLFGGDLHITAAR